MCFPAAARTSGVPGVPSRAQPEDDRGEEAGAVPSWGLERGRGPKSPQVFVRAPQSSGREGEGKTTGGSGTSGLPGGRAADLLSRGESTFLFFIAGLSESLMESPVTVLLCVVSGRVFKGTDQATAAGTRQRQRGNGIRFFHKIYYV